MGHRFEDSQEAEVAATPEQVWDAIATGPGIDSWFMGRNNVEPGTGGIVRTAFGGYVPELEITEWDPPRRLAYGEKEAPDGRFIAYQFLVEGRDKASTVVRVVTSGFLPGDDWEDEYEAMTTGGQLFFRTLVEYLTRFPGRAATPVTAFGPPVSDWDRAWSKLREALGLTGPVVVGAQVRGNGPAGSTPMEGDVYFVNADTLGIRTDDALYRFLKGFHGPMVASHHLFAETDQAEAERAWHAWLARALS